ncbi:I78 family peptidase inhibitor [Sphingomonas jatrophae]|uniref:I78 family peptidase inhibitor n=1 Tax=Sphingomonas jatrophae TaxID=1166337 RepID=UPI001F616769|nr:I78 family peptidase inhibitor [Sphingomonas jatrophae]
MPATCKVEPLAGLIGGVVDAGSIEGARRRSGAATVRVVRPGQMVTQDYREDRLNLTVDGSGRLVKAACG